MLKLEHATIQFKTHLLFKNSSLTLARGTIKGFVAPNGYGKTTVMRILAGELRPLKYGTVRIDGSAYRSDFRSSEVLYIPGDASLLHPYLTVSDHLRIAASLWSAQKEIEGVVRRCGVSAFAHKRVASLSQGMKQQVALAIAYLCSPHYLLLDEPTNALDPINVQETSKLIEEMSETGTGVLISSHILESLDNLCDSVLLVNNKRIDEVDLDESARDLFRSYYQRPAELPRRHSST